MKDTSIVNEDVSYENSAIEEHIRRISKALIRKINNSIVTSLFTIID